MVTTPYDFGYHWWISYGLAVPLVLAAIVAILAWWRGWPRPIAVLAAIVAAWAAVGVFVANVLIGLDRPVTLPTARFLASGTGRVLDAGAGSGRAAIGVLLARPKATVTALDLYQGDWGIEGNTPERFIANARIAGVADRAEARTGDMRHLPFADGTFDAFISAYALDHLRRDGRQQAVAEAARVLAPRGELLLLIVRADWLAWLASPHAIAHHPRQDPAAWRSLLERNGFVVEEEGTQPATLYIYARKRS